MTDAPVFCEFFPQFNGMSCRRCGSWTLEGNPTCPPYITRFEIDKNRLPHIKTHKQNKKAHQVFIDDKQSLESDTTPDTQKGRPGDSQQSLTPNSVEKDSGGNGTPGRPSLEGEPASVVVAGVGSLSSSGVVV